jgi:hypothetical protein
MKSYIVGRLPAELEVGGVTTFLYNLGKKCVCEDIDVEFLDIYPARNKEVPLGLKVKFLGKSFGFPLLNLALFSIVKPGKYFFNFSSVKSLLFFVLIPRFSGSRWTLVLHNGDLTSSYKALNLILKILVKFSIRKFDRIGYITNSQLDFYKKFSYKNLCKISPYIENDDSYPALNESMFVADYFGSIRSKRTGIKSFVISGFPKECYRLIETVEVLSRVHKKGFDFYLNICVYGIGDVDILNRLILLAKQHKWINLYSHLNSSDFTSILDSSDVYIRMNTVDSFGLVCAEAISRGTHVIATDVCDRYKGVWLISPDDFNTLELTLKEFLNGNGIDSCLSRQPTLKEILPITDFITGA